MATYRYMNDNEEVIERDFSVGEAPVTLHIEGCEYVKQLEFGCAAIVKSWNGVGRSPCSTWPRSSTAMGVAEEQVPEMMAHDRKHGVPTEYTKDGDPILTGKGHEKRYMDLHGFAHRGGCTGAAGTASGKARKRKRNG